MLDLKSQLDRENEIRWQNLIKIRFGGESKEFGRTLFRRVQP